MITSDTHHQDFKLFQPFFSKGMTDYNELLPNPSCMLFYEFTAPGRSGGLPLFDGLTCIASACSDILFITGGSRDTMELVGACTGVRHLKIFPGARYFGVRLLPGNFFSHDGVSLRELSGEELFFPCEKNGTLGEFFDNLKKTEDLPEKAELFIRYFGDGIEQCRVNALTRFILDEINAQYGNIRVSQLAEDSNYSERHISRIFQENMGLSPKSYARIIRFQYALDLLLHTPADADSDFFYDLGYSDQAHFQREFKEYTGTTPKTLYGYFHK